VVSKRSLSGKLGVMKMKFNKILLANTSAVWVGIIYLVCRFLVVLFPELSKAVTQSWFHGIDIVKIWSVQPIPGNFLLGLVSATLSAWVAGWAFASIYNYFAKK